MEALKKLEADIGLLVNAYQNREKAEVVSLYVEQSPVITTEGNERLEGLLITATVRALKQTKGN